MIMLLVLQRGSKSAAFKEEKCKNISDLKTNNYMEKKCLEKCWKVIQRNVQQCETNVTDKCVEHTRVQSNGFRNLWAVETSPLPSI